MREIDKLKKLTGKKVANIKIEWDDLFEDYFIESITFDDDTVLELWCRADCVSFALEKWESRMEH